MDRDPISVRCYSVLQVQRSFEGWESVLCRLGRATPGFSPLCVLHRRVHSLVVPLLGNLPVARDSFVEALNICKVLFVSWWLNAH
jgi:hypothetical protein